MRRRLALVFQTWSNGQCGLPELVGQAVGHGFRLLCGLRPTAPASPTATESLGFDRANGFRGGFGYRFGNGWNVAWTYTYFFSASTETVTANPVATGNPTLLATQSYLDTGLAVKTPMSSVEADGALLINIQDFEAEWSSCLNDAVGFKVFGGFRWAKIDQNFQHGLYLRRRKRHHQPSQQHGR